MQIRNWWSRMAIVLALTGGAAACGGDDPVAPTPLAAPTAVQATRVADGVRVTFAPVTGAKSYNVERDQLGDAVGFANIGQGVTGTEYLDNTADPATAYLYRVVAVDGTRTSPPSATAEVLVSAIPAPANVRVTRVSNGIRVNFDAAAGASSYEVERDQIGDAAGFVRVAQNLAGTEFVDTTANFATTYQYRVVAVSGSRRSSPSSSAEIGATLLTGSIRGDRTLEAGKVYLLQGVVAVDSGGVLTIPAGTTLLGDATVPGTALVVRVGGKIEARGTAQAPIVLTSSRRAGQRQRGDWGGVVLNGRSLCSFPAPCRGEANSGEFGGNRLNDNSGTMTFVRIEYAGFEVSPGNELNGLTLNGVGSGTTLHHIQVHMGLDDGIEWFGGTVDLKYALVTGADDDSFDYSTGWQGRGQFWIAQQEPREGDRGFEVDGNESNFTAQPFTDPRIYNVTLIGGGPQRAGDVSPAGMQLRRGAKGQIYNAIILGFNVAFDIDNAETLANCLDGSLVVANTILAQNTVVQDPDSDTFEAQCLGTAAWSGIREVSTPLLSDPFNRNMYNFQPAAGSAASTGAATPPNDGFFEPANFIGGVAPSGTPWYAGWTTNATS